MSQVFSSHSNMEQADRPGHISGDDNDDDVVDADQLDDTVSDAEMVSDGDQSSKAHLDDSGSEKYDGDLEHETTAPDGGYGWVIVLGSSLAHFIIGGLERSDGVFFLKFINKYHKSAQATAWVSSLCSAMRLLLGPFASCFSNRFSCRAAVITGSVVSALGVLLSGFTTQLGQLYFTFGIISGIGRSLAYTPCLIITGMYFDKRLGLALGMATAGVGAGTFIIPPVTDYIFKEYGYLGAFLILSGFCLNLAVCGILLRPLSVHRRILEQKRKMKMPNTDSASTGSFSSRRGSSEHSHLSIPLKIQDHIAESENFTTKENRNTALTKVSKNSKVLTNNFIELSLLKEPLFLIFCLSILLFTASFKAGFTFLPALVKSSGLSESNAALILSISGVFDTAGRIVTGFLFDFRKIKQFRGLIYNIILFAIAIVSFICPTVRSFAGFAILASVYGWLTGSYLSQKSVIIVDILGVEKLSSSLGLLVFFQGLGTLIGPPLSGMMKDIYGEYHEVFYFCGGIMVLSGLIMLVPHIWLKLHSRSETTI